MSETRRNLGGGKCSAELSLTRHFNFFYNYYQAGTARKAGA